MDSRVKDTGLAKKEGAGSGKTRGARVDVCTKVCPSQPFKGLNMECPLHGKIQTRVLMDTLVALGTKDVTSTVLRGNERP